MEKTRLSTLHKNFTRFVVELVEGIEAFFSFKGVWEGVVFWSAMVFVYVIAKDFAEDGKTFLSYALWVSLFYCAIAAVQKRCRNFGSIGTWWILVFSLAYILKSSTYFIDISMKNSMFYQWRLGWYAVVFTLIFIPSKSQAEQIAGNIRSPLLKYPLLYVGVCWVLMIAGTLAVNHFAGIEVALF